MIKTFVKDLKREFKGYNGKNFSKDLMAGLTVTAVALPLALAFGVSSGADAAAGLITAIIAGFVISAFAGASFQISGPTGAMTAVLITHYMEEAVLADRVVVMNDGNIVLDGAPCEVFTHVRELREIELDVPQPTELCYRLRQQGVDIREDVLTVEECTQALLSVLQAKK